MAEAGYVYVLLNPSLKGLVKIGRTARLPKDRADELSAPTGCPTPFEVVYDHCFADACAVEQFLHSTLTEKGFRKAANREFFEMPVTEAVKAVVAAQSIFDSAEPTMEVVTAAAVDSLDEICDLADALWFGEGDVLEDEDRAVDLYRKAAAAGSMRGLLGLANAFTSRGTPTDWAALRPELERAMHSGVAEAGGFLAIGMISLGHQRNASKCWAWFFRRFGELEGSARPIWAVRYICNVAFKYMKHQDCAVLMCYREEILRWIAESAPDLQSRAEIVLSAGVEVATLRELPELRGRIIDVDADGDVSIYDGQDVYAAHPVDVAALGAIEVGQYVAVVHDPRCPSFVRITGRCA